MNYPTRIYYTEADKALMWDRSGCRGLYSLRSSNRAGNLRLLLEANAKWSLGISNYGRGI